jgi:alkylhydroperoxidase family enzyme
VFLRARVPAYDISFRAQQIDRVIRDALHEQAELFLALAQRGLRSALAWAETVTCVAGTGVPDDEFKAAAAVFDQKQLADLTIAIGPINAYNRLAISFREPPAAATITIQPT